MPKTLTLNDIQADAVAAIRGYRSGPTNEKTGHLKDAAEAFLGARQHFFTKDGEPDLVGRTFAYRRWSREIMFLAEVPTEEIATLQAAIRYHTGNALRETLSPEQLADLGLRVESPLMRSAKKREGYSATLSVFGGGGQVITDADEIVSVLATIDAVLRRIVPPTTPKGAVAKVRTAANAVYTSSEKLAGVTSASN